MDRISSFETNDERINQLQRSIVSSQIANSIHSHSTDCPQREKEMDWDSQAAYAPTMCFNTRAHAFYQLD